MNPEYRELYGFVERYYRATETAKRSIRLSEVVGDILRSLDRQSMPMDEGMLRLIEEAGSILNQIAEMQTMTLRDLLRLPYGPQSDETLQKKNREESDGDLPEPVFGCCQVLGGIEWSLPL